MLANLELTDHSFGEDLRALRKSRGMTLADLAVKLGRSVGWMSQVERGLSKPTIEELRKIVAQLDAPISLFFGRPESPECEHGRVVRANSRRQLGWAEVGLSEELLSPDLTDDFEMLRSSFEPGASLDKFVQRPTQEVGYLVQGKLRMWIGEDVFDLNVGDSFRIRNEKFKWQNPYAETAVAIWVIAPPIY